MNKYIIKYCCYVYNYEYLYYLINLKSIELLYKTYKLFNYAIVNDINFFINIDDYLYPFKHRDSISYCIPGGGGCILIDNDGYYEQKIYKNKLINIKECYNLMI